MKILFSAALNFKMINKTRSVDSRGSLKYSRADKVMSKAEDGNSSNWNGSGERVQSQCVLEKLIRLQSQWA